MQRVLGSTVSPNRTLDLAFDQHPKDLDEATVIRTQIASGCCAELGQWTDGLEEFEALYLNAPLTSSTLAPNLRPSGFGCSVWLFNKCGKYCVRPDVVKRMSSCSAFAGMFVVSQEKKKSAYALLQANLLDLSWRTYIPPMTRV
jgi:hypothetical protein